MCVLYQQMDIKPAEKCDTVTQFLFFLKKNIYLLWDKEREKEREKMYGREGQREREREGEIEP